MPRKLLFIFLLGFIYGLNSCKKEVGSNFHNIKMSNANDLDKFQFPKKKQWRHQVNCVDSARKHSILFEGIEIDVYYEGFMNVFFNGLSLRGLWKDTSR